MFEHLRNLKWEMLLYFFCKHHQARASFASFLIFSGIDASKILTSAAARTPWSIELMHANAKEFLQWKRLHGLYGFGAP